MKRTQFIELATDIALRTIANVDMKGTPTEMQESAFTWARRACGLASVLTDRAEKMADELKLEDDWESEGEEGPAQALADGPKPTIKIKTGK